MDKRNATRATVIGLAMTAALVAGAAANGSEAPTACADALVLADAVATQGQLTADLATDAATHSGERHRVAAEGARNAADAYGWTVDAYSDAAAACRAAR